MVGSKSMLAYLVALASASNAALAITSKVESSRCSAATTHQVAAARRKSDIASYVANAPRNWVGPRAANNAAARNPAQRPKSRVATPHSRMLAPSMKASDSSLAPIRPPALAASAANGW